MFAELATMRLLLSTVPLPAAMNMPPPLPCCASVTLLRTMLWVITGRQSKFREKMPAPQPSADTWPL
jgi:hypothetical protein